MIIHSINTKYLKIPLGKGRGGSGAKNVELIYLECVTDQGIVGNGFSFALTGGGSTIKSLIDSTLKDLIIGTDILNWEMTWLDLYHKTHRLGKGVSLPAISAIDIAVWDVKSKFFQLPLYKLLGQQQKNISVYGSGQATHNMTTEELIEGAMSYKQDGYTSIKLRAGALGINEDLNRIRSVRENVPEMQIMVDCNERLNYAEALSFGRNLQELDIFWLEEPLVSDDLIGHKRLADKLTIPIAVGEHLLGRHDFVNYIESNAAVIFQPDCPLVGGITEAKRIATIAEGFGLSVSPHFLPELHVHIAASSKNCISIEHFPLIDDILEETLSIENGYAILPTDSGHAIKWDYDKINHFEDK